MYTYRNLIQFIESEESETWNGIGWAVLMGFNLFAESMVFQRMFLRMRTLGIKIRASLIAAVYQKALCISEKARQRKSSGEIVNLVSVDVERVQNYLAVSLWDTLAVPFQISLAIFLLYSELGFSAFAGLFLMVFLIIVNAYLTKHIDKQGVYITLFLLKHLIQTHSLSNTSTNFKLKC